MIEPLVACHRLSATLVGKDGSFRLIADGFSLLPGEAAVLTGPSGSGKSLFLELLALVRRPDAGSLFGINDGAHVPDVSRLWDAADGESALADIRRTQFGFVPQSGELLPFLSVRENISLSQQMSQTVDRDLISYLLDRLEIAGIADRPLSSLSIGQRQRVAIARALAHRPRLILADEPTAALDQARSQTVIGLMVELVQEFGTSIVLSTHDVALSGLAAFTHWICQPVATDLPENEAQSVLVRQSERLVAA